jgi:hypothetical protein
LAIAGQAVYPPLDLGALGVVRFVAMRQGPVDQERWLLVCLAAPPILVFTVAALAAPSFIGRRPAT